MVSALPERPAWVERWDAWYARSGVSGQDPLHRELREMFLRWLPAGGCDVLDLACGEGHDVRSMAMAGHRAVGLDFSATAIAKGRQAANRGRSSDGRSAVDLRVHDIASQLTFPDGSFDAVFSHLGLHYFDYRVTGQIFCEIWRVLRPGGLLVFSVKSTKDRDYGVGVRLGEHIFDRDGHVRHFFDEAYAKTLLEGWAVELIEPCEGTYAGTEPSAFLRAVARRASRLRTPNGVAG